MMIQRNGFHRYVWLIVLLCLGSVNADESADKSADKSVDDIVTMMGWWDDYGRYWEEMDALTISLDDEMTFALLEGAGGLQQETVQ